MSNSLSPEYFSLLILDPSKLPRNQNVRKIFNQKDPPTYCLFVNTKPCDNKITGIRDQYNLQWICEGQYCFATLKTTTDYYVLQAEIRVFKPSPKIYGVLLCIRETNILYIPFDKCTEQEIQTMLYRLEIFHPAKPKIHIICIQLNKNIRRIKDLAGWGYHALDIQEYCLRYNINFHILVNNRFLQKNKLIPIVDLDLLTQEWSNPDLSLDKRKHKTYRDRDKDINYGLLIYIADWRLNHLKKCIEAKTSQNKSKTS
jgi:hypothetical protein